MIQAPNKEVGKSDLWRWADEVHNHLFPVPEPPKIEPASWSNHEEPPPPRVWHKRTDTILINRAGIQWPIDKLAECHMKEIEVDDPELYRELTSGVDSTHEKPVTDSTSNPRPELQPSALE